MENKKLPKPLVWKWFTLEEAVEDPTIQEWIKEVGDIINRVCKNEVV